MGAPRKIDWERIEPDWRAGIKSVLQIASDYEEVTKQKVSHTAINKHFKQLGIPRNLNAKVMAKADAIVSAAMVSGKVSIETTETDAAIIDVNAMTIAQVRLSHRKRVAVQTDLVDMLTEQLTSIAQNRAEIEEAIYDETALDENGKRRATMMRAVSLSTHASTIVNLTNALKTLICLERQAFNIKDESETPANAVGELLKQVGGTGLAIVKDGADE